MKRKRLIIIIAVVIIMICLGLVLYTKHPKQHMISPSQQMIELRQLEAHLDLPKPKYRDEADLGPNKDWMGAVHYDRHIALSYEDASVLDTLRTKLLSERWQEQATDVIGTSNYFSFKKGTGKALQCVGGFTQPNDSDGITLYVSLEAAGEFSCNPDPGT